MSIEELDLELKKLADKIKEAELEIHGIPSRLVRESKYVEKLSPLLAEKQKLETEKSKMVEDQQKREDTSELIENSQFVKIAVVHPLSNPERYSNPVETLSAYFLYIESNGVARGLAPCGHKMQLDLNDLPSTELRNIARGDIQYLSKPIACRELHPIPYKKPGPVNWQLLIAYDRHAVASYRAQHPAEKSSLKKARSLFNLFRGH